MPKHKHRHTMPAPAHPTRRREALPWEHPVEDPQLAARLGAIMQDPSYAQADHDVDFLHADAMRAVRLQLDYLKAEQALAAHDIRQCIVVLGSTRLREPAAARRALEAAQRAAQERPEDPELASRLRLAQRRAALSDYYEIGREFGRLVGEAARAHPEARLAVMTGGGPGGMEAANRGAFEAGSDTIGLNIALPREQYPNPYLTPGLCFQFHYFALRKLHFMKRAAGMLALPGGYGTLDELFGALTLIQTRKAQPFPIVLIGQEYWERVFDMDFLLDAGSIDPEDRELFWFAESAEQAWEGMCAWHRANGRPLFGGDAVGASRVGDADIV